LSTNFRGLIFTLLTAFLTNFNTKINKKIGYKTMFYVLYKIAIEHKIYSTAKIFNNFFMAMSQNMVD